MNRARSLWAVAGVASLSCALLFLSGGTDEARVRLVTPDRPIPASIPIAGSAAVPSGPTVATATTGGNLSHGARGKTELSRESNSHGFLGRPVGSEGYGPHIAEVAVDGNPGDALTAYRQMVFCSKLPALEQSYEAARAQANPAVSKYQTAEYLNKKAEILSSERNRCQTVDAGVQALAVPLTKRAADGKVEGGAEAFATALLASGQTADWPSALKYLREAAARMDGTALGMLAYGDRAVVVDDVERVAYQLVMSRLEIEGWPYLGGTSSLVGETGSLYAIRLEDSQFQRAKEMAEAIYSTCCTDWKKRKK